MIEVKLLYDPVTKQLCKKRVTNTLNQMGGEWGSFILSIQKSFNERLTNLEEYLAAVHVQCQTPILARLYDCDKKLSDIHTEVQNQIINSYVPLRNATEEILTHEYETVPIPKSESELATANTTTPEYVSEQVPSSSSEYVPSKVDLPGATKTTGKVPCLEIDLCDGLYARLTPLIQWFNEMRPLISVILSNYAGKPDPETKDDPKPPEYSAPYGAFYEPVPDLADVDPAEGGEE